MRLSNGPSDWLTPQYILDAVGRCFPTGIDLDPCANPRGLVKAKQYYQLPQDGLTLPWFENVYCNPPFSRGQLVQWANKAARESIYYKVNILFLCPASTETEYFQDIIFPHAQAICFLKSRVKFLRPNGLVRKQGPQTGHAVCLFSQIQTNHFRLAFESLGTVWDGRTSGL